MASSSLNTEPLTVYNAFLSDSEDDNSAESPCSPVLASHLQATAREMESHRSVLSNRRLASVRKTPSSAGQSTDLKHYALVEMSKRDEELAQEKRIRQELEQKLISVQHERDESLQANAAAQRREKVLRLKIASHEEVIQNLRSRVAELEADVATVNLRRQNSSNVRFVSKKPQDTPIQVLCWAESVSRSLFEEVITSSTRSLFREVLHTSRTEKTFTTLRANLRLEQQRSLSLEEQFERNVLSMTESRDSSRILRHFRTILAQLLRREEEAELVPRDPPIAIELLRTPPPPAPMLPPWYPPGKSSSLSYHPNLSVLPFSPSSPPVRTPSPSPRRKVPPPAPATSAMPKSRTSSPLPHPRSSSQQRAPLGRTNSPSIASRSASTQPKPKTAITYLRLESPKPVASPSHRPTTATSGGEPRILPLTTTQSEENSHHRKPDVSPIHAGRTRSTSPTLAVAHDIETLIKELERWRPKH